MTLLSANKDEIWDDTEIKLQNDVVSTSDLLNSYNTEKSQKYRCNTKYHVEARKVTLFRFDKKSDKSWSNTRYHI